METEGILLGIPFPSGSGKLERWRPQETRMSISRGSWGRTGVGGPGGAELMAGWL